LTCFVTASLTLLPPASQNAFSYTCLCLSVSVCIAVNSESLELESSFSVCRYILRIFMSSSYQGHWVKSRSQEQSVSVCPVCRWSACDWKAMLFSLLLINLHGF